MGGGRPATDCVARAAERPAIDGALQKLAWAQPGELQAEAGDAMPAGLLGHQRNDGPVLLQVDGHGKQQRPAARHDDPLSADRHAGLDQCLQSARPHHVRQGPTGEGEEPLAGAGGQDQLS